MSTIIQNVLYVGKNNTLVEALLSTLTDGNSNISYHTDFKIWSNEIVKLLSVKKYHYFITEQAIPSSVSDSIKELFPDLKTTYLTSPKPICLPSAIPTVQELLGDDVKNMLNLISIPIYYKDRDGTIILCNQNFANHLGLNVDDVIGHKNIDFLPDNVARDLQAIDDLLYEDRQVHLYEEFLHDLNGVRYEVLFRKELINSSDIHIGIVFDVSELNEAKRNIENEHMMLRASTDVSPDLIFFKDLKSRFLGCNKQFEKFIGQPESRILGKTDDQFFEIDQAIMCQRQDQDVMQKGVIYSGEEYLNYVDGERHFVEMKKVPLFNNNGKVRGLIAIGRDITAQHRLQKRFKVANAVFENSQENIVVTDQTGKIVSINQSACELFGYQKVELLDKPISMLSAQDRNSAMLEKMCSGVSAARFWKGDITYCNKHQEVHFAWLEIYHVELEEGERNCIYSFTDLTQNKHIESKIKFLSKHDPLTGLSNRIALFTKLEGAIHRANFNETIMAVLLVDINDFKLINDQYGHNEGDKILQEIACRLNKCVLKKDTLARFGDDEFVIVVDNLKNENDAALIAQQISAQFNVPFVINDVEVHLSATIGISLCPDDGQDVDALLLSAEKALLRGRKDKVSSYHFYTDQLTEYSYNQLQLETELSHALEEDQFELYYKPQYDLNKKQVTGVDSLLRWNHPTHGVISSDRFLSLAEESGFIVPLGLKMLEKVALQTVCWKKANINFGRISIDISLKQLEQIRFIADIQTIIKETGCSVVDIEFDICEKIFNSDHYMVHENLFNIRKLGIAINVAGFGANMPILHFVEPLGIDKLKIAQSYINDLPGIHVGQALIKTVQVLARELGVDLVGGNNNCCEERVLGFDPTSVPKQDLTKAMRLSEATFYLRCNMKN